MSEAAKQEFCVERFSDDDQMLVEELRITEEELRVQNDELVESRLLLAQEREHYRSLFESAPVPYLITDRDGVIHAANRAAGALLHVRPDRMSGKPFIVFVSPRTRSIFRQQLRRLSEDVGTVSMPLKLMPRDAAERVVTATVSAFSDALTGVSELRWLLSPAFTSSALGDLDDLRRRVREAEHARKQAEGALRSMSDLMGWASHEIRTPAASIGGYADILAIGIRGMLTPDQQAILVRIQQAQKHLVGLLDDLLTFSRAGAGQLHLDVLPVPLEPIFERLITLVEPQAAARDIRVSVTLAESIAVLADSERVLQILLNLVGNALKFTPLSGTIEIHGGTEGDSALVAVRDSGQGVPLDSRERIFQPYVQLGVASHDRVTGAGLGLAISRELARAMGGDLACVEGKEGGTVFVLRLPRSTGLAPTSTGP